MTRYPYDYLARRNHTVNHVDLRAGVRSFA